MNKVDAKEAGCLFPYLQPSPYGLTTGKAKETSRNQHALNALFCLLYTLISPVFPDSYLVNTLGYLILICYTNRSFAIKFPSVFAILLSWLTSLCTLVLTRDTF